MTGSVTMRKPEINFSLRCGIGSDRSGAFQRVPELKNPAWSRLASLPQFCHPIQLRLGVGCALKV
jgi:hypothetical protein